MLGVAFVCCCVCVVPCLSLAPGGASGEPECAYGVYSETVDCLPIVGFARPDSRICFMQGWVLPCLLSSPVDPRAHVQGGGAGRLWRFVFAPHRCGTPSALWRMHRCNACGQAIFAYLSRMVPALLGYGSLDPLQSQLLDMYADVLRAPLSQPQFVGHTLLFGSPRRPPPPPHPSVEH